MQDSLEIEECKDYVYLKQKLWEVAFSQQLSLLPHWWLSVLHGAC